MNLAVMQMSLGSNLKAIRDLLYRTSARDSTHHETSTGSKPPPAPRVSMDELSIESIPPPAYSKAHNQLDFDQGGLNTHADVSNDGRVNIKINQRALTLSNLLVPALRHQLHICEKPEPVPSYIPPSLGGGPGQNCPPPMNVVIHVVGSRGDVQPFVALGKVLKRDYNHRVRLATHPSFKEFVEENGLEFFSIGGDPAELMAFMVKNPGLMPGMDTLRSGDIGKRRKGMYEIIKGCWRSCIEAGDGTGIAASDDAAAEFTRLDTGDSSGSEPLTPFVADAIIANPPSFAHVHCAERLGIPLHLMFTMPWTPTQAFPHPLANIQSNNSDLSLANFISYALVEMMTWQGLGDVINRFRERYLGLESISLACAPGMVNRMKIPFTYCWSPALIPKPRDWGSEITISGFFFLSLASNFTPDPDLAAFLEAGPPPVYIGFGSIVVDDPNAMTKLIFEAVKKTGQRALVSKGWGGFGANEIGIPEGVFMLGNVPHDWLFKHVSCVVHHGGAGTTAAGIALGRPTVVVPFFGDQAFWGAMTAKAGAGPAPIPYKTLTADKLAGAILEALEPNALARAGELGDKIREERGCDVGAQSFHTMLDYDKMRCAIAPNRVAVWRVKRTRIQLSALAATVLGNEGLIEFGDLKQFRPRDYMAEDGALEPISGGASALLGTIGSLMGGVADLPIDIVKSMKMKSASKKSVALDEQDSAVDVSSLRSRSPQPSQTRSRAVSAVSTSSNLSKVDSDLARADSSLSLASRSQQPEIANTPSMGSESLDGKLVGQPDTPKIRPSTSTPSANGRGNAMSQALNGSLFETETHETSGSRLEPPHPGTTSRQRSSSVSSTNSRRDSNDSEQGQVSFDDVVSAGKSALHIVDVGVRSPMDFTLSLARGFHNAPRLYGDESVRAPEKITGFHSGLKAAGKEFGYGLYDGISGLVTQPLKGAEKEGFAGAIKGFGKGIGGVVLKPSAAFWGVPGYTFRGIYREIQKRFGANIQNYIYAARATQGYEEWKQITEKERNEIINNWKALQISLTQVEPVRTKTRSAEPEKQKRIATDPTYSTQTSKLPNGFWETRHLSFSERKALAEEKKRRKEDPAKATGIGSTISQEDIHSGSPHGRTPSEEREDAEFEEAIRRSVAATSRGDDAEDRLIERAIRASVLELKSTRHRVNEDQSRHSGDSKQNDSIGNMSKTREQHNNDSGIDTDEDIKQALQDSLQHEPYEDDSELRKAIEESRQIHQQHQENESRAESEERVVMEYIKKQSLLEKEHHQLVKGKEIQVDADDDPELRRAIEESLKTD
ncbi:MAG: hypothetical protein M1819_000687 [Sarea resinae]|nr:MAG: hypothetical protein M1819_000687 [Sarea resinae]